MSRFLFPPFALARTNPPEWTLPLSGPFGDFEADDLTAEAQKHNASFLRIEGTLQPIKTIRVYLTLWAPDKVLDEVSQLQDHPQTVQGKSCRISLNRSIRFTEFDRQFYRAFQQDDFGCPAALYETRKVLELTLAGFLPRLQESLLISLSAIHPAFNEYTWEVGFPLPTMEVICDQLISPQHIDGVYRHKFIKLDENTLFIIAKTKEGKAFRIEPEQCQENWYSSREKFHAYDVYRVKTMLEGKNSEALMEACRLRELSVASSALLAERTQQTSRWPTWADLELLLFALPLTEAYSITIRDVVLIRDITPNLKRRIVEHRFSNYSWFLRDNDRMKIVAEAWMYIPVMMVEFAMEKPLPSVFAENVQDYLCAYLMSFFPAAFHLVSKSTIAALDERSWST